MGAENEQNHNDKAKPATPAPAGGEAGTGPAGVQSKTPENAPGHLNPSAPEDSNTTPGTTSDK